MDSNYSAHLARLRDAGVISDEELRAALEWQNRQIKPKRRGGLLFCGVAAATVALLAFLLIFP